VSAGSAATVLAANRRLVAACDAQEQPSAARESPLIISVMLEGIIGSDAGALAEEAGQCSRDVGWKYTVINGKRLRARAEVASVVRRYDPELLVVCCADEGWLPSASYLVDDHPGRLAPAARAQETDDEQRPGVSWENSEPASRTWLPIVAELIAGFRDTPTLALLGTPHPCNSKASRGKTGVASMLAQIFVVGGAATQRILPSQNKRQKVLGHRDASADTETVRVEPDVHGKCRVERIVGKRIVVSDETPAGGTDTFVAEDRDVKVDEIGMNDVVKQEDDRVEYLVKWYGLGDANATWEPAAVSKCTRLALRVSVLWRTASISVHCGSSSLFTGMDPHLRMIVGPRRGIRRLSAQAAVHWLTLMRTRKLGTSLAHARV
jgi:hypothetical protein